MFELSWEVSFTAFAAINSIGALIFTWLQYSVSARKPDLDAIFSNGTKEINFSIPPNRHNIEIIIKNNGNGVAKFVNLKVFFPNTWNIINPSESYYFSFSQGNSKVIEYNGTIYNVIHSNSGLGLKDWIIDIPANQYGRFEILYSVQCENADEKKGRLYILTSRI